MKIGILGGTFDPPHLGHLAIGRSAMEHLNLDEVLVIPAGRNPLRRRRTVSPGKKRLRMVELAFGDEPGFAISDIEISRPGPSYAVDTVEELQMAQPADYWFIVGSDLLGDIAKWHQPEKLLKLCRLAVAVRPPGLIDPILQGLPSWIRERIDVFPIDAPIKISSTEIRDHVLRGISVAKWLNPAVLDTIKVEGLYKD